MVAMVTPGYTYVSMSYSNYLTNKANFFTFSYDYTNRTRDMILMYISILFRWLTLLYRVITTSLLLKTIK